MGLVRVWLLRPYTKPGPIRRALETRVLLLLLLRGDRDRKVRVLVLLLLLLLLRGDRAWEVRVLLPLLLLLLLLVMVLLLLVVVGRAWETRVILLLVLMIMRVTWIPSAPSSSLIEGRPAPASAPLVGWLWPSWMSCWCKTGVSAATKGAITAKRATVPTAIGWITKSVASVAVVAMASRALVVHATFILRVKGGLTRIVAAVAIVVVEPIL